MILYLDTSALVGLFIKEDISQEVRRARKRAERVASSILAFPETLSAFSRKRREGELTAREHNAVSNAFRTEWRQWVRIPLDRRLLPEIARILKHYPLTGADAVHMATALLIHRRLSTEEGDVLFACNDVQLRAAAESDGLVSAW
jgi:uncharacterized protein